MYIRKLVKSELLSTQSAAYSSDEPHISLIHFATHLLFRCSPSRAISRIKNMSDQRLLAALALLVLPFACLLYVFNNIRKEKASALSAMRRETPSHPVAEQREVYYSSHSFAGSFRHVALFFDRTKYEVKQDEESHEIRFSSTSYPGNLRFPFYLGEIQARLQFRTIGQTSLNDSQINQTCNRLAKGFVYNLLSNNCQDFAFLIACGLVREGDRSENWDVIFGPKAYQLDVLAKIGGIGSAVILPEAYAQICRSPILIILGNSAMSLLKEKGLIILLEV